MAHGLAQSTLVFAVVTSSVELRDSDGPEGATGLLGQGPFLLLGCAQFCIPQVLSSSPRKAPVGLSQSPSCSLTLADMVLSLSTFKSSSTSNSNSGISSWKL